MENQTDSRSENYQAISIYFGKKDERIRRIKALRELANKITDGNVSALVQQIADGKLVVFRREDVESIAHMAEMLNEFPKYGR